MNERMREQGSIGSPIRWLWGRAEEEKRAIGADNVFDFTLGNPSAPAPKEVNETLIKMLNEWDSFRVHSYSSFAGDIDTRNAVAEHLQKTYGANVSGKHICMMVGAAAAVSIGLNALINEGEEVLTFSPHYPEYVPIVNKAGGRFVTVQTDADFFPDEALLRSAINEKTRVLIVNSPNNPTGVVYGEDTIKMIARVLREKSAEYGKPIYLFSDEPYRELIYDNKPFPFVTNYYEYSVVGYSFSKSLSIPGERIGYLLTGENNPEKDDLVKAFAGAGRSLGFVCASSMFQRALPSLLDKNSDFSVYRENRDFLMENLKRIGYEFAVPQGAFYLFVKALDEDEKAFTESAIKHHLYFVPSIYFGSKGYVRLALCVDPKTVRGAIPAFEALFREYEENR